jgi:signal peptidase I
MTTAYVPRSHRIAVRRPSRLLVQLLLIAVLGGLGWWQLGPTALGGRNAYVVTDGISMWPTIKGESLVVVRREPSYHVGEIVAYHNAELHRVVLHRIVAMDGNDYVFKGDNNSYRDADDVSKSQLIGEKYLYWHAGGVLLTNFRNPIVGGVLFGLVGMWAVAGGGSRSRPRHRRRHHRSE